MKRIFRYLPYYSLLTLFAVNAGAQRNCANCDPCAGLSGAALTCCRQQHGGGSNPFDIFSASVHREVADLDLAVQVGEYPMNYRRIMSSRPTWAAQVREDFPYGHAAHWRHSFLWTILDDGITTNGDQKIQVIDPRSQVAYYHKKNPGDLFMTYLPKTQSRVLPDGTNYFLYYADGSRYHITQKTNGSYSTFRMEGFLDPYSNQYQFVYDSDQLLSEVRGPNTNHFFRFLYARVTNAVDAGIIRFTYVNASASAVCVAGTFCSPRWNSTQYPMTQSNGQWFVDVDLGKGFYAYKFVVNYPGNTNDFWYTDPQNNMTGGPYNNSIAVIDPLRLMTNCVASDGRNVSYSYDWVYNTNDSIVVDIRLLEANYGGLFSANYTYYEGSYMPEGVPALKTAIDPMLSGPACALSYNYHTNAIYGGMVYEERSMVTSQLLGRLQFHPTDANVRYYTDALGNTSVYSYVTDSCNIAVRTNAIGYVYKSFYNDGWLSGDEQGTLWKEVDPLGRTSVYTRLVQFGAVLSISNSNGGCGCGADVLNVYTDTNYPFYLASQTRKGGLTTTWTRDARNRPIRVDYPDGTYEMNAYNEVGQLVAQRNRDGSLWTWGYDTRSRKVSETDPLNNSTLYSYDAYDRLAAVTNALGYATRYTYDWRGQVTNTLYADGSSESVWYDAHGNVTQRLDRAGGVEIVRYDALGQRAEDVDPVGATNRFVYDAMGRLQMTTSPLGLTISNTYDDIGRKTKETFSSDGTFNAWFYDPDGVRTQVNRMAQTNLTIYDEDRRVVGIRDANGGWTTYGYDEADNRVAVTNALGNATLFTFDEMGRATSSRDCQGAVVSNVYDGAGRLVQQVEPGGIVTSNTYDAAGRPIYVWRSGLLLASNAYNSVGWIVAHQDASGVRVSNTYDAVGRVLRTYMPDSTYFENVYSNTRPWKAIDRAGRVTITQYDPIGRPVQVTDPANRTVQYRYDLSGKLTNLVDQAGNNTFWAYDIESRPIRKTYADASHWNYTYDAAGRLASRTDAKNQTTVYKYDAVGNLTNINYPNDADVSYVYDAMNRIIQMTDGIGATIYEQGSGCGMQVSEDGPFVNDTLYFGYTDAKQLASITSAFQNVAYTYDNLQRLKTVVGPEGTNTYSYEGAGNVWRNLELGNGTAVTRQYDVLLRLTNMVNNADAGVLSSFAVAVDDADQRTRVVREDGTRYDYSYDAIGQLTNASATLADDTPWQAYQFGYQYDETGNPAEQDKNGLVYSNSFNNLNQNVATIPGGALGVLGRVNYAGGTVTVNSVQAQLTPDLIFAATGIPFTLGTNALNTVYSDPFGRSTNRQTTVVVVQKAYDYDANGNLTNDGCHAYLWDDENRLIAVRNVKTWALLQENRYDGLGRRRESACLAGGVMETNRYLYQGWLVLGVTDGEGNVLETYTHGADLSGRVGGSAGGIGGILASIQSETPSFYHYDFNGNVVQVSSSNQTQLAKYTYSPFGEVLLKEGTFDSRYQFSTKELDGSTGMNYYGYRFYSPVDGGWSSRDQLGEYGGFNLYGFVYNSPINRTDYLGLTFTLDVDIGKPFIASWSTIKSFSVTMEVRNDLTCKPSEGCWRLSLIDVEMTFYIYAGFNSMHELLHAQDAESIAYNGIYDYATRASHCYSSEPKANCIKDAIEDYLPNVYISLWAMNTILDRDINGGQIGHDYQQQFDDAYQHYQQYHNAFRQKITTCNKL